VQDAVGCLELSDQSSWLAQLMLNTLLNSFKTALQGMGVNTEETLFQKDGARTHTVNVVLNFLSEHFHDQIDTPDDLVLDGLGHYTRKI
jgi:hypothetical protein